MARKAITRRAFLRSSAAGAALAALPASGYARVPGAAERMRLAVIGPGQRGRSLLKDVYRLSRELNVQVAAVCDIWKVPRERAAGEVKAFYGEPPAALRNTDELYARKDIDAVVIATADHQHAKMCVEAVRQGKDVYVEKPLAHFLDDALEARRTVEASRQVVQVGTQRRSSPRYRAAPELIRSGRLGEVVQVDLRWNVNQPRRWRREEEVAQLREEDTDWKRFLLHLPAESFDPRKELEFRLFWPFSSGIPDQWMCHLLDPVAWFTGDPFPRSCVASGAVNSFRDGRQSPDTFAAAFEYPKGFQVVFQSRMNNSDGGVSEVYYSRWGKLDLRAGVATGDGGGDDDDSRSRKLTEKIQLPEDGGDHMRDFFECVRSRRAPNCDIQAGFQHSVALCMAIEALHTGKKVGYDAVREKLVV